MNNYYYIRVKIGKTNFYLRQVTWFKNFEPVFEPIFVTNFNVAGLFFKDQVKKILEIYPDAAILQRQFNNLEVEFYQVPNEHFTR
jgi:hypothetical protein